jgi:uncharacterized protein (DUF697 family)
MKKSPNVNEEVTTPSDAQDAATEPAAAVETSPVADASDVAADRTVRLKAAQDQAAQYLREERYTEAKRALREAEQIQAEDAKTEWLAEAKAAREKALLLTTEGKLAEAKQALEQADELAAKAAGRLGRPKQMLASFRTRLRERSKVEGKEPKESPVPETPVLAANDPIAESLQIVRLHAKIAAAVGLLPGGLLNFVGILAVQVPMVWRIARKFGHSVTKEQVRGVLMSLFASVIPGLLGHGTGLAIASIPAAIAGTVVYFVATPILAYALTRAVGNVFIMHFESGGTLLTFDPKAFAEYFVNEFKKAGGTVRQADEVAPEATATPA